MSSTTRRRAFAVVLSLSLALLAGCSGGGSGSTPTAAELYQQARDTAKAATSAHVTGSMAQGNEKAEIDLAGTRDGKNQKLILKTAGVTIEIMTVDGNVFMKTDTAFWEQNGGAEVAELIGDKYVTGPMASSAVSSDMNLGSLLDDMFAEQSLASTDAAAKVEKSTLDGADVYVLSDPGDAASTITVSADGKATIHKIKATQGELTFTDWNAVTPFAAPSKDQIAEIPGM